MTTEPIKGYKVTDQNLKCRQFKFELNTKYSISGKLKICENGFHFCQLANDCFNYYNFDPTNRVFEVIATGEIVTDGDKSCTSEIELIRELTWLEVLTLVNTGKDNTGRGNSGYRNSGDRNSGNCNSGYRNSGDSNSGNWNSGYRNSGDRNSGNWNSGDSNSGDSNSGNWNSGNWNSGNRNSGDSNSGYRNDGAFCADTNPTIRLFDKPTSILVKDWEQSEACRIMSRIEPTIWVDESIMSAEEKLRYPKYETTGGYLKTITMHEAWANLWGNLSDEKKAVFTSLENFDAKKFKTITGIKI